jgi:DNA-binding CsgD family transcriptional regulator
MTADEVAVYVHLQTVQDYLSEREKAFLVLTDETGAEITLPSRMPLTCFRRGQTDAGCARCYRLCLAAGAKGGAGQWTWLCPHGLEHVALMTAFVDQDSGGRYFLLAGRSPGKNITELARVTAAFYSLPLRLKRAGAEKSGESERPPASNTYDLTAQELVVLTHMARGLGNRDIAELLFVSINTIKTHITHILTKMEAKNRTEAALIAVRESMLVST